MPDPLPPQDSSVLTEPLQSTLSPQDFLFHLTGEKTLRGKPKDFPSAIDLGSLSEHLTGLREQAAQINSEVARLVYLDPHTKTVEHKDRTDFNETSVKPVPRGPWQIPLIEVHTHPGSGPGASNPSVVDYAKLLMGYMGEQIGDVKVSPKRSWNAIVVISPENQILALATDKTPILDPEIAVEFVQRRSVDEKTALAHRRSDRIINTGLRVLERLHGEHFQKKRDALSEGNFGALPDSQEFAKKIDAITARTSQFAAKVAGEGIDVIIEDQRRFVESTGIKLYTSTDFRHFEAIQV